MRGNGDRTTRWYRDRLKLVGGRFGKRKAKSLKVDELQKFFHELAATVSPTTQRHNLVAFDQVMRFALDRGEIEKPWYKPKDLPKPKARNRDYVPTAEQLSKMLSVMRPDAQPVIRCLRLCGARPSEICAAQVSNLEGKPGTMSIVLDEHKTARKTGMKRTIRLSPAAEAIVLEAITGRESGTIFRTASGLDWNVARLSREFRRCRNHFGFSDELVLYSMRHTTASLMIDSGADISEVKLQLGHTDIGTTQRYVHPDDSTVRRSVMRIEDVLPLKEAG